MSVFSIDEGVKAPVQRSGREKYTSIYAALERGTSDEWIAIRGLGNTLDRVRSAIYSHYWNNQRRLQTRTDFDKNGDRVLYARLVDGNGT